MSPPAGLVLLALLLASSGRTDEGLFPGGRRVQGSLSLDRTGWHFVPAGKTTPLTQTPRLVRFDLSAAPPLRAALVHRVTLRDGGSLTGVLLDLDEKQLTLRTAWAQRLSLPRRAVAACPSCRAGCC